MAKKTKFEIKKLFDKKFWNDFGMETYSEYKKHTFNKSNPKMSDGNPFPRNYTPKYSKAKRSGKLRRQDSSYRNLYAPVLTGDLMRDTQVSIDPKKNQVAIGWSSHADKVSHLRDNKRVLTDNENPYPKDILQKKLMPKIVRHLDRVMPEGTEVIHMKKKK